MDRNNYRGSGLLGFDGNVFTYVGIAQPGEIGHSQTCVTSDQEQPAGAFQCGDLLVHPIPGYGILWVLNRLGNL